MHFNFKWNLIVLILVAVFLFYQYGKPYIKHIKLHYHTKSVYKELASTQPPWQIYGTSQQKHNIYFQQIGDSSETTIIFGAFHGDEQSGFHLVKRLGDTLLAHPEKITKRAILVPVVNPDGLLERTRVNANGVDINRNFPTENWTPAYEKKRYYPGPEPGSEIETQLVMQMISEFKPVRIITIHDALEMNNYNGPALELAEMLKSYNGYPVTADVGYPTPGSFGNYAGTEQNIAVVTLELPDIGPDEAWEQNGRALIEAINFNK